MGFDYFVVIKVVFDTFDDLVILVPFASDKCILERDKVLDLIDEIRGQYPSELAEAKKLVAMKNDYLSSAKREADATRQQAELEAQRILDQNSLLSQAKLRAMELARQER